MEVTPTKCIVLPITSTDSSQVGHARRQAVSMADAMGFSELRQSEFGIVVTEAARNIAVHALQGEILLCPWHFRGDSGIDLLALDNGQGIADVGRSFEDGFSTAGTAGQGLGAMSRLSAILHVYSSPGSGTALFSRVVKESSSAQASAAAYEMGVISVPIPGETACGDGWGAHYGKGRSIYIVADGLGHGPLAEEAAREATRTFRESFHLEPARILADAHGTLAKTRGAAISVAEIDHDREILNYAGIGNVAGSILHAGTIRSIVSMNGTVGHTIGRIQQFSYPFYKNSSLIMHSDGLATRWSLEKYPGLSGRHPALIAGILYRDFCRKRDDVTVLVTRV